MNLGDNLNAVTGLVSSSYASKLGNTLSQNVFGAQTTNTFGLQTAVFIDGIRLWEAMAEWHTTDPTVILLNFAPTPVSLGFEKLQQLASLGGLGVDLGLIPRTSSSNPFRGNVWAGVTGMNIGDVASLNYKGDSLSVNRAVNQLSYSSGSGPENATDFLPRQSSLQTFFLVLWGTALLTSLVFVEYSVTIAVDQSVANNEDWQIANLAMEVAQMIVLYLLGNYETSYMTNLATNERMAAELPSNDGTIDSLKKSMDDLEKKLQGEIDALASLVASLQATSSVDLTALTETVTQQGLDIANNAAVQSQVIMTLLQTQLSLITSDIETITAEQAIVGAILEGLADVEPLTQEFAETTAAVEVEAANSANLEVQLGLVQSRVAALNGTVPVVQTSPATVGEAGGGFTAGGASIPGLLTVADSVVASGVDQSTSLASVQADVTALVTANTQDVVGKALTITAKLQAVVTNANGMQSTQAGIVETLAAMGTVEVPTPVKNQWYNKIARAWKNGETVKICGIPIMVVPGQSTRMMRVVTVGSGAPVYPTNTSG